MSWNSIKKPNFKNLSVLDIKKFILVKIERRIYLKSGKALNGYFFRRAKEEGKEINKTVTSVKQNHEFHNS
jgi:hypothetical protein